MESKDVPTSRHWYKKKRYMAILGLLVVIFIATSSDSSVVHQNTQVASPIVSQQIFDKSIPTNTEKEQETQNIPTPKTNSDLSNNNYYTNTQGNKVHSPAYSETIPVGASAKCKDGTYSFSQSRSGTCSRHGGVMRWL